MRYFEILDEQESENAVLDARTKLKDLTLRESQIVQLISNGHSNKDIARILSISIKTVEKHRSSAIFKSGCRNSFCLVRLFTLATHCVLRTSCPQDQENQPCRISTRFDNTDTAQAHHRPPILKDTNG